MINIGLYLKLLKKLNNNVISKDKLKSYNLNHYQFSEENVLNGEVLAASGDLNNAQNVSVASRNYGQYSYSLKVW